MAKTVISAKDKRNFKPLTTAWRMLRYGVESFIRNAWLSLAAILVMSLTLWIIFVSVAANDILKNAITDIRQKVDMSIYLKNLTETKDIKEIKQKVAALDNVRQVEYISAEAARKEFAEINNDDKEALEALTEAIDKFPITLRIKVKQLEDTTELEYLVKNDQQIQQALDPNNPPTFLVNNSREAVNNIAKYANSAEKVGIGAVIFFTIVALLVMFNTIRMAIFNRKGEIYMMKLIGASKAFIRTPFVIEAIISSMIASAIALGLGYYSVNAIKDVAATKWLIDSSVIDKTILFINNKWYLVAAAIFITGALISGLSSFLATRRYLKND